MENGEKTFQYLLKKTNYVMMERIMRRRDETVSATEVLSHKPALKTRDQRMLPHN